MGTIRQMTRDCNCYDVTDVTTVFTYRTIRFSKRGRRHVWLTDFNPITATACKNFRAVKVLTYTLVNSVSDSPITNLIAILCILIEFVSRAHAKRAKALMISSLALSLVFFGVTVWHAWE